MDNLLMYIYFLFSATLVAGVLIFFKSANYNRQTLKMVLPWILIQSMIGLTGFYGKTNTMPPRFILVLLPPLALIVLLFATPKGRNFIEKLDLKYLTLLHLIRIPVEMVLYGLFLNKAVPEIMVFDLLNNGKNPDIISGLTAPIIYYWGFVKKTLSKKIILIWNIVTLALLMNIVITALFSAPFPFQKLAFDQPNIAILHFPFLLLPGVIVPMVLLSHLTVIRSLILKNKK